MTASTFWLLVPVGLLAILSVVSGRIPAKVYALIAVPLWLGNGYLFGWWQAAASLAAAVALLAFGIVARLSRRTGFGLACAVVGLPLSWLWLVLPGLLAAAAVSARRLRALHGAGHVTMVGFETMTSLGVDPTISPVKPDLSRLPVPENTDAAPKLNLLRWCAAGAASGLAVRLAFVALLA